MTGTSDDAVDLTTSAGTSADAVDLSTSGGILRELFHLRVNKKRLGEQEWSDRRNAAWAATKDFVNGPGT